jgi:hypothetical protein
MLLVAVLCASATLVHAIKITVKAEADPKFDFRPVKTWAWDPAGAGDVKMARASEDDPAPIKGRVEPVLLAAVAQELAKKGWRQAVVGSSPDIRMHYYLLITVGMEAQTVGQFLPPFTQWGVPPFVPATQSLSVIQRGSIVLDAFSPTLAAVVWRGVAQGDIDKIQNDKERDEAVRQSVHDLVVKIPPLKR